MDLGLKGRAAIITAASQGLGYAAAEGLAREGVHCVVCSRDAGRIREAAESIARAAAGAPGGAPQVVGMTADVRQPDHLRQVVATAAERFGRIDILVNNAGGPPVAQFASLDDGAWMEGHNLTLMSAVRSIREVLPHMLRRRWGRVITITSVAAKQPINDLVISSTLRPGILGLTKVMANRYGADGILFNAVAPGYILTARQEEILAARIRERGISREQYLEEAAREIPLRRLGRPDELADAIVFLASERAAYINGITLSVDGGLVRGLL